MSNGHTGIGLRSLFRNTSSTVGRQLNAGLLGLATLVIIARVYGPVANGAYAVALLLPTMLSTFLNLGIGSANVYYLASGKYRPRAVLRTSVILAAWLSLLGLGVGGLLIVWYGDSLFPGVPVTMLWLALLAFPIMLLQQSVTSIFQGLQKFGLFNLSLMLQPLVTLAIVIGLSVAGVESFSWLITANLLGVASTLLITGVLLRRYLDEGEPGQNYEMREAVTYGYKAHLGNILGFANYKADMFLVNFLINPAAAGVYVIAVSISERLWVLSGAVSTVALPRLAGLSGDESIRRTLTPLLSRIVLFVTLAGALAIALIASPLVSLVFGSEFSASVLPLKLLLPGIVVASAARIMANDIAARGRPELNMYTSIVTLTTNIVGNLLLIPEFGLAGAAIATTVAYTINLLLRVYVYWRLTGVAPLEVLIVQRKDFLSLKRLAAGYRR